MFVAIPTQELKYNHELKISYHNQRLNTFFSMPKRHESSFNASEITSLLADISVVNIDCKLSLTTSFPSSSWIFITLLAFSVPTSSKISGTSVRTSFSSYRQQLLELQQILKLFREYCYLQYLNLSSNNYRKKSKAMPPFMEERNSRSYNLLVRNQEKDLSLWILQYKKNIKFDRLSVWYEHVIMT